MPGKVIAVQDQLPLVNQKTNYQAAAQNLEIKFCQNYRYVAMKIFSTVIPNDRNICGDNIATKKDNYVIVPETIGRVA